MMERQPNTSHLPEMDWLEGWSEQDALDAAKAIEELIDSPGWPFLIEALKAKATVLQHGLTHRADFDAAFVAKQLGEMRGLTQVGDVAAQVLNTGRAIVEARIKRERVAAGEAPIEEEF